MQFGVEIGPLVLMAVTFGLAVGVMVGFFMKKLKRLVRQLQAKVKNRVMITVTMFRANGELRTELLPVKIRGGQPMVEMDKSYYNVEPEAVFRGSGPRMFIVEGDAEPKKRDELMKGPARFSARAYYEAINSHIVADIMRSFQNKYMMITLACAAIAMAMGVIVFIMVQQQGQTVKQIASLLREMVAPAATELLAVVM